MNIFKRHIRPNIERHIGIEKMSSVQVIAQQGDEVFKKIMEVEPTIASLASVVLPSIIPAAGPVIALVQPEILVLAPIIEKALKDIGSTGSSDGFMQLIMHLTKGLPNAAALSPST